MYLSWLIACVYYFILTKLSASSCGVLLSLVQAAVVYFLFRGTFWAWEFELELVLFWIDADIFYVQLICSEYHLGQLKAKIAKLRTQLLEPPKVCKPFSFLLLWGEKV